MTTRQLLDQKLLDEKYTRYNERNGKIGYAHERGHV
jgi:hypothetical protein